MHKKEQALERVIQAVFLLLGLVTVGCVLLITIYLILSGIPAIRQIGLLDFLLGDTWASTAPPGLCCSACRWAFSRRSVWPSWPRPG